MADFFLFIRQRGNDLRSPGALLAWGRRAVYLLATVSLDTSFLKKQIVSKTCKQDHFQNSLQRREAVFGSNLINYRFIDFFVLHRRVSKQGENDNKRIFYYPGQRYVWESKTHLLQKSVQTKIGCT
ncbi:hypothetical protein CEXT_110911 [Caerostris extrusa]|uniref:Uncharacterized protein n=1 Tax=Caerostris extrusa TaxID=172846 RepID=A0AAV4VKI8_CAEEX|nr:hypothetical protein CEXT_110911 [Caerostris extrusa]